MERIWWTPALAGLLITSNLSCSGSGDNGPPVEEDLVGGFSRSGMLASIGERVILPTYRAVAEEAAALEVSAEAYADALATGAADTATRAADAREAYHRTMSAWQRAELMQLGPAGSGITTMGGQGLRDAIYSWPTVNPCRIDQVLVDERYEAPSFFEDELVNVYGLDALEYLLFAPGPDNACPPQLEINQGAWGMLGAEEVARRRAAYAARVAANVRAFADQLVDAWDPAKGDFLGVLGAPDRTDSPYSGPREAVDALFHAMYYVELEVKDMKLALPAGVSVQCPAETCPEDLESRFADRSRENVIANLEAFRALFLGNLEGEAEGTGFDDFLAAVDAGPLAEQMDGRAAAALATAEALQVDLRTALAQDPESVRQLHADVKALTDLLKSQFVTVLNLSVPQEGAADND